MKIDICQVCRGDLYDNNQNRSDNFMVRLLSLTGYYRLTLPKVKTYSIIHGWCRLDICPNCFNEVCDLILKKKEDNVLWENSKKL